LIDGNASPREAPCPVQTIVKGDAISLSISAASIIAKVTRDRLMERLHEAWPLYGFSDHMGYGTPAHLAALRAHGPCPYHRYSFAPVRAAAGKEAHGAARNLFNL
jgi:ribonuclease HII